MMDAAKESLPAGPRISCIGIPTADRPAELLRALWSYYRSGQGCHNHNLRVFVSDNSRTHENTIKVALGSFATSINWPVFYAGPEEKAGFIVALQSMSDAPPPVLEFALFGVHGSPVTAGANRNAILLHTIGDLVLSADDDTVCQPATLHGTEETTTLTVGGTGNDAAFWFFPGRASAVAAATQLKINIFSEHERLLGKALSQILSTYPPERIRSLSKDYGRLESAAFANAQIRITFTGVLGDSGMFSTPKLVLHSGSPTIERLDNYISTGGNLLDCRDIGRQWLAPTICRMGAPMTTATGLDNRTLLPPFLPVCRNQDEVFGATLKRCIPSALCGHLPFTIVHDPAGQRRNEPNWASAVRLCDLVLECITSWSEPVEERTPSERMLLLGQHVTHLGELAPARFEEFSRSVLLIRAAKMASHLEARLASGGDRPTCIRDHLATQLNELRQAITRRDYGSMRLDAPGSPQHMVKQFGQLLSWWPEILRATSMLREQGISLGQTIAAHRTWL
ncbi:MAG: hypothetical protein JOZ62_16265 [Acidobacteriaceae bacterium]|nr:hypothetical protein [Acidobacteriaceae bacterium]